MTLQERVATARHGETIVLPDGDCFLTSPLQIHGKVGTVIRGGVGTNLIYVGPSTETVVDIEHCDRVVLRDVSVSSRSKVESAIRIGNGPIPLPQGPQTTACKIENCDIPWDGGKILIRYGIHFDSTKRDANNDLHQVISTRIVGAKTGIRIWGSQCHRIKFTDVSAVNYAQTPDSYGLHAEHGVYFIWENGAMVGWDSDFRLGSAEVAAVIRDHNSEMSHRLISCQTSGSPFVVAVEGGRFDLRPLPGQPVVDMFGQGPLNIRDAVFISGNQHLPTIRLSCYSAGPNTPMLSTVNVTGCAFYGEGKDAGQPIIEVPHNSLGSTSGNFLHVNQGPGVYTQREALVSRY